jgi:hypothetical protein
MTSRQRTISLKKFLGLNLKLDPMEFGRDSWQTKAENIDITDANKIRTRRGQTLIRSADIRSLHGNRYVMLGVEGQQLAQYPANDPATPTTIRADLHPTAACVFVDIEDETYYSDGRVVGKFVRETPTDWLVEVPPGSPSLAAVNGGLAAGCYFVNVTFTHLDGRESGCLSSVKIDLAADSGIRLTNIPQPVSSNIGAVNIYCSDANSSTLYLNASLAVGATTHVITERSDSRELTTQFMSGPPRGTALAYSGSRIWVASGRFLYGSMPFTYHLFDYTHDYLVFGEDINLIAYVSAGLFVSADRLYFVSTIEQKNPRRELSEYKAITGTLSFVDGQDLAGDGIDARLPVWAQEDGIVVGLPNGTIRNLTEGKVDIGSTIQGATLFRKEAGLSQVVSSLIPGHNSSIYTSDTVIAEVKTRGISL